MTDTRTASVVTTAELRRRAATLLPAIAAGAADREHHRVLPHEQIRDLARAQLLTFRVPRAHGGPDASVHDLVRFVVDLAAADSNIAQALRPGFAFVESLRFAPPEDQQRWYGRALRGDVFGNAGWERGGANGEVRARISRTGDHHTADGTKYYSTGALYADWITTTATDDDGQIVAFTVPRDRAGLHLADDFDSVGQRLTASGTTLLDGVAVQPGEIRARPFPGRRSPLTALLQLYLGAVEAGIARNALTDAAAFARDKARPIRHSNAERTVDDPYVRHTVGEIAAHAYAAEAVVLRAATAIDRAWAAGLDPDALTAAAVEVAQAQIVAVDAALRAAEIVFDVGGGSAVAKEHNLDRHWRNARTVANHNPRHWKAAVVGDHHLTGAEPPTSGLF